MQESLAEISLARLPARRAQHGAGAGRLLPGHARRRPRRLPARSCSRRWTCAEAVELAQLAFHLADQWRNPVLVFGDYYLAHTDAVGGDRADRLRRRSRRPTGRSTAPAGGTGRAKVGVAARRPASSATTSATTSPSTTARARGAPPRCSPASSRWSRPGSSTTPRSSSSRSARRRRTSAPRCASLRADGAPGRLRAPDHAVPFPTDAIAAAADGARAVAVYENNQGQMIDDVRLAVLGRCPVEFIGGLSLDSSGFGIAPDLDVAACSGRGSRRCCGSGWTAEVPHETIEGLRDRPHATHRRPSRRGSSTTSRPRSSTSASTTCAPAAASRSRCARCSRRSPSSALIQRTIAVFGIGCYTAFSNNLDVEVLQALHGRAPSLATGVKRAKPDTIVFTVQGDGDMVNEGLQEVHPRRRPRRERSPASCSTTACSARPAAT